MAGPEGGTRASLASMVAMLSAPFRGRKAPTNTQDDLTQFDPIFLPDSGNFSPGRPLVPPQREPIRAWNYPYSWNTIYTPRSYENISFEELRALAENWDVLRLLIETRKDQIEKLNWNITPRDTDIVSADAPDRAEKLEEFFAHPDGYQSFGSWLRELLEDLLVIDAPTLEVRRNRAGDIIGLDVIDGSTIKVLLDYNGRTPRPPAPAYEQIIHGRPWSLIQDGQRTNEESADDPIQFTDSELIYMPRNRRAHKAYGFSPVEQIIITVNIGLRRQISQLNEFTDGNMPPGLITAPSSWNPDQIANMQDWWDTMLSGNLANKRKLMWGPDGAKYQRFFEAPLKDDFDEWLARVACFAFSIAPTPFTKMQNRGEQEASKEASLEEGLAPLKTWVKRLIDSVIQRRMGHDDLEFSWADDRSVDPATNSKILAEQFHNGGLTLNEYRDELGRDPVDGGDHVMFMTPSGPLLLSAVVGGTGYPRELIDNPPNDPADRDTTMDEQPGAIPDQGTLAPEPPRPGRPGDSANPRKDPNAGDNTDQGPGTKVAGGKIRQAEAAYVDTSPWVECCADCTMFRGPDTCTLVGGAISPRGWCRYFEEVRADKASRPFSRRARLATAPGRNAALVTRTERQLTQKLHGFFRERSRHVAAQIHKELPEGVPETREAAQARARAIIAQIDLGDWSPAGSNISEGTAQIYSDSYRRALRAVGYRAGAETINQARANLGRKPVPYGDVSPFGRPRRIERASALRKDLQEDAELAAEAALAAAVAWANAYAAGLVVDIAENTRGMLQATVADAIEEGLSASDLADRISASVGFSEARAETIARTELIRASNAAVLDAYKQSGVVDGKSWLTAGDDRVETNCEMNEADGVIPLDNDFSSGDSQPPAHPNCRCALQAEFFDEGAE